MKRIKGLSLFSGGGIGEMSLKNTNLDIVVANELLKKRCEFYKFYNPKVEMICGDIKNADIKNKIIKLSKKRNVDFVIATPPCQGASLIGKNKTQTSMQEDIRNYLIFDAIEIIKSIRPSFVLFENVPRFFDIEYPYKNKKANILEILKDIFSDEYNIDFHVFSTEEYGVPQIRKRGILRMWKFGCSWNMPKKEKKITVRDAIGDLPSLESGEKSSIKNHNARKHTKEHVDCMKYTPSGHSAFENIDHYPKTKNGKRVKGFSATFKRIEWDEPAPTITMRNDCISSQSNVHPGRLLEDGTYSDARVLTLREIFILSSIDPDIDLPPKISESQVRYMIGEGVPPLLMKKIVQEASYD